MSLTKIQFFFVFFLVWFGTFWPLNTDFLARQLEISSYQLKKIEDLPKLLDDAGRTFSSHLAVEEKRTVLEFVLVVVIFLCSYSISCSSSHIDTYQRPFKKKTKIVQCAVCPLKKRDRKTCLKIFASNDVQPLALKFM